MALLASLFREFNKRRIRTNRPQHPGFSRRFDRNLFDRFGEAHQALDVILERPFLLEDAWITWVELDSKRALFSPGITLKIRI